MGQFFHQLGWARAFAGLVALATLPCLWLQHVQTMPWSVIVGAAAPGIAFFLIWAIPFDALMARVFMSDKQGPARARYRTVICSDIVVWLLLLLGWGWFFLRLIAER